jgi:hypothetical protein
VAAFVAGRAKFVTMGATLAIAIAVLLVGPLSPAPFDRIAGAVLLALYPCLTAIVCWWCAWMMPSVGMRTQWVLLGVASFFFGAGQYLEEFRGYDLVPGFTPAKALYLGAIVAFGVGVSMALRSFAGLLDARKPVMASVALAVGASVFATVASAPVVSGMRGELIDRVIFLLYPIGVLWLMVVPSLALALTVSQMGKGALARPWWAVFVGVALIACSNLLFVVLTALGTPLNNAGPMEFGWWIGMAIVAIGASMQIDVQKPLRGAAGYGWTDGQSV